MGAQEADVKAAGLRHGRNFELHQDFLSPPFERGIILREGNAQNE